MLVEFFLQQCSKRHPHHSLLYIFLLLFYMIFTHLATLLQIDFIQFFLKFNYKKPFPPLINILFSCVICIRATSY
ncbi:hypothetical protein CON30_10385 [Bacillus cereus]|nr:hypothetical protein CON30_10385 [Bacillus cereus]PER21231.1 hypothetical protein CN490_28315 [Bacillus cereus]